MCAENVHLTDKDHQMKSENCHFKIKSIFHSFIVAISLYVFPILQTYVVLLSLFEFLFLPFALNIGRVYKSTTPFTEFQLFCLHL